MRIVFASLASPGHTYPMVPLAIAARDAGHEVHFAAGESVHEVLSANGLRPFRPNDAFYDMYAEDLLPQFQRLRPDLVVAGWGVPGAAQAADRAGMASVWHGFGRLFPEGIGLASPLALPARPHLDICPPSLQDKAFRTGSARIELRPVAFPAATTAPAKQVKPFVYVTFGTTFATAPLLSTVLNSLAGLDLRVLAATGNVPPESLGELPDNAFAKAWVQQAAVLSNVDLVIHHGGSGTTLGALAAGVPQLFLPQGADQFTNAETVVAAGAGLVLDTDVLTEGVVTEYTWKILNGGYREAARTIAHEIARMPSPDDVALRLPDYAR
jgi:UDP:flavonoid glycosyltransferase YjiC (YdhE family)